MLRQDQQREDRQEFLPGGSRQQKSMAQAQSLEFLCGLLVLLHDGCNSVEPTLGRSKVGSLEECGHQFLLRQVGVHRHYMLGVLHVRIALERRWDAGEGVRVKVGKVPRQ